MIEVTIKKSKWLRSSKDSVMRDNDGNMCCLGFCGVSSGIPNKKLLNLGTPFDVYTFYRDKKRVPESFLSFLKFGKSTNNNSLCEEAIKINDSKKYSDKEKIRELTKLLPKLGFNPTFVD